MARSCQVVVLTKGQNSPLYLAVDAEHVYFTLSTGEVFRIPLTGGTPELLYANSGYGQYAAGIAVDSQFLYWSRYFDNTCACHLAAVM